jgi:hypothetical protein
MRAKQVNRFEDRLEWRDPPEARGDWLGDL